MAGHASNWFKTGAGSKKGRVFVSNKALLTYFGGTPASAKAEMRDLAKKVATSSTYGNIPDKELLNTISKASTPPTGQAITTKQANAAKGVAGAALAESRGVDAPSQSIVKAAITNGIIRPDQVSRVLDVAEAAWAVLPNETPPATANVAEAIQYIRAEGGDQLASLGAGPLRAFLDVTMRVVSQGILAGATFAFIVSFGQFDVSLFLATSEMRPLPVALYDAIRYRTDPSIAAAGVFAISTVFLSMTLVHVLTNRGRRRPPKG